MKVLVLFVYTYVLRSSLSLDNGLGKTPQMGWNSWNHFGCSINDQLVMETADAMVGLSYTHRVNLFSHRVYEVPGRVSVQPCIIPAPLRKPTVGMLTFLYKMYVRILCTYVVSVFYLFKTLQCRQTM